ncbi:MAG: hypothetical protein ACTSR6_08160 [Candidatus Heimdallarchaeota archaeon]
MTLGKREIQRKVYSLNQHHINVVKKIAKMKSKSNTAGVLLDKEINAGSDIMATLFLVLRESIEEANEDKKYFMGKLRMMNKISEALGDYLKELNEITIDVNNANKNNKNYDEANLIGTTIKRLDKMIGAVNSCSSALSSSRDKRKNEAMLKLRQLKTNIIQAKKKLKQKKPIKPVNRKSLLFGKSK